MALFRAKFFSQLKLVQTSHKCFSNKIVFNQPFPKLIKPGEKPEEETGNSNQVRYNVCREKAPSIHKMVYDKLPNGAQLTSISTEKEARLNVEEKVGENVEKKGKSAEYPSFSESNTCKNVTLPLKSSKLANPFPEPVKMMPSHTVSDQEKAEQMFQDSRMAAQYKK